MGATNDYVNDDAGGRGESAHAVEPAGREVLDAEWDLLTEFQSRVIRRVERAGYDEHARFAIRLALEEALANAYKHGNSRAPDKPLTVEWDITPDAVTLCVEDEGSGFSPEDLPDPTSPEHIERPHGRGVMLMRAYMHEVSFDKGGCRVTLVYRRSEPIGG